MGRKKHPLKGQLLHCTWTSDGNLSHREPSQSPDTVIEDNGDQGGEQLWAVGVIARQAEQVCTQKLATMTAKLFKVKNVTSSCARHKVATNSQDHP
jgi:hypothetical protein